MSLSRRKKDHLQEEEELDALMEKNEKHARIVGFLADAIIALTAVTATVYIISLYIPLT